MIKPFNKLIKEDLDSEENTKRETKDESKSIPMVVIGIIVSLVSIVLLLITIRKGFG